MVELVQVVLAREDGAVGQHLSQDAANGPDVDGFGVALNEEKKLYIYCPSAREKLLLMESTHIK